MAEDKSQKFKGCLPYASELFGVYQPLLGWKGKQAQLRLYNEQLSLAAYVAKGMFNDSRVQQLVRDQPDLVSIVSPDTLVRTEIPAWLKSVAANHVQLAAEAFYDTNARAPANGQEWASVLNLASTSIHAALNVHSSEMATSKASASEPASPAALAMVSNPDLQTPGSRLRESLVAGMLDYWNRHCPEALNAIFTDRQKPWQRTKDFMNCFEGFDGDVRNAVLSPIGLITLYREYFFELDTFLGPPVEHIWVSPGGSVEVFEVHTHKKIMEKQVETAMEVTTRSEVTTTKEEELSDAVKQENQQSDQFATSASGGVQFAVWGAQGSISYNRETAHNTAAEMAHKVLRQQSEKLTNEIRRSFKTTFKTVVETNDMFSRRYVIQNTTDKLANYELRRVYRHLKVQLQYIGDQLCWQVYIDNPGDGLALPDLVHVARPEDMASGIQPPEAPPTPQPKQTMLSVLFDFFAPDNQREPDDHRYFWPVPPNQLGDDQQPADWQLILAVRDYTAPPPAPDYALKSVNVKSYRGTNPNKDPPRASYQTPVAPAVTDADAGKFKIVLESVNFEENPSIQFELELNWDLSDPAKNAAQAAYKQKVGEFQERERREAHKQYVELVRERIKLASRIAPRDVDALRGEERAVVSGRIIQWLMRIAPDLTSPTVHVTAELIQQFFEVDKLLYFVAPYWWMPRKHWRPGPRPDPFAKPYHPPAEIRKNGPIERGTVAASVVKSSRNKGAFELIDPCQPIQDDLDSLQRQLDALEAQDTPQLPTQEAIDAWIMQHNADIQAKANEIQTKRQELDQCRSSPPPPPPPGPSPNSSPPSPAPEKLTEDDIVGWGGLAPTDPRHGRYFITEDSAPAPMGASLGWLLQLDGDDHRNAFLNSPWVKAVLPIRPCMEAAALKWLMKTHVEGCEGIDEPLSGAGTLREKIRDLAQQICCQNSDPLDSRATEKVFETGFDPLEGGFRFPPTPRATDKVFDQWTEVLPTKDVVAVEYHPEEHEGCGEKPSEVG